MALTKDMIDLCGGEGCICGDMTDCPYCQVDTKRLRVIVKELKKKCPHHELYKYLGEILTPKVCQWCESVDAVFPAFKESDE